MLCIRNEYFCNSLGSKIWPQRPSAHEDRDFCAASANPSSFENVSHSGGFNPHFLLLSLSLSDEECVKTNSPGCDATDNVHLGRSSGETDLFFS